MTRCIVVPRQGIRIRHLQSCSTRGCWRTRLETKDGGSKQQDGQEGARSSCKVPVGEHVYKCFRKAETERPKQDNRK